MTSTVPAEFGSALRTAIERSGLSLNEISRRLRARETPVSISALSYWQNGENRPERASSLAAVTALEAILGQQPETLTGLLGPRRPRGRLNHRTVAYDLVWRRPETVARALAKVDATPEELDTPHRLSQYVSFRVDGYGHEESIRVRRLVRADHDGTSRFLFVTRCSSLTRPPVVLFTEGCRPARFRADVPSSTCAFEFVLDRTLAAGELAVVEFGVRFPPGQAGKHAQIAIYRPARDLALRIAFDPARLPRSCAAFFRAKAASPPEERGEATLDRETGTFQFITLDPLPGQYGIRWSWT